MERHQTRFLGTSVCEGVGRKSMLSRLLCVERMGVSLEEKVCVGCVVCCFASGEEGGK